MAKFQQLDQVPATSLVTVTQTAVGCGIGLLLARHLGRTAQRNTALALFAVSLVSVAPLVIDLITRRRNRPGSERVMRRRLESISHDSGLSEDAEIF